MFVCLGITEKWINLTLNVKKLVNDLNLSTSRTEFFKSSEESEVSKDTYAYELLVVKLQLSYSILMSQCVAHVYLWYFQLQGLRFLYFLLQFKEHFNEKSKFKRLCYCSGNWFYYQLLWQCKHKICPNPECSYPIRKLTDPCIFSSVSCSKSL